MCKVHLNKLFIETIWSEGFPITVFLQFPQVGGSCGCCLRELSEFHFLISVICHRSLVKI